jgi:methionine synthase II (cobalamin-independent)
LPAEFIDINNALIDFGHDLGLTMWMPIWRGNYASRYMGGSSYVKIAEFFFRQLKYDCFFHEYDEERACPPDAIAVSGYGAETKIVLGLLSNKTRSFDDEGGFMCIFDEASIIIPKSHLPLSHKCGFASCDGGDDLTKGEQWAKIEQAQKIAQGY